MLVFFFIVLKIIIAKTELESRISTLENELDSERLSKNLLEGKNASKNDELSESEEIERLNEELTKLQTRFSEQLNNEEKRRLESTEQYQVN